MSMLSQLLMEYQGGEPQDAFNPYQQRRPRPQPQQPAGPQPLGGGNLVAQIPTSVPPVQSPLPAAPQAAPRAGSYGGEIEAQPGAIPQSVLPRTRASIKRTGQITNTPQVASGGPESAPGGSAVADYYAKGDEQRRLALTALEPDQAMLDRGQNAHNMGAVAGMFMQGLGGEQLAPVGGTILKQALADRQKYEIDPMQQNQLKAKKLELEAAAWDRRAAVAQSSEDKRFAAEQARLAREHAAGLAAQARAEARADRWAMFGARQDAKGAGTGKSPTESEAASAGYLGRMRNAENLIATIGSKGRPSLLTSALGYEGMKGLARPYIEDEAQQKYRQAQEDWVRAKLRKESGAVIGADEMEREIRTYFPMPGEDSMELIDQKAMARRQAEHQLRSMSGKAPEVPVENAQAPAAQPGAPASARRLEDRKREYLQ